VSFGANGAASAEASAAEPGGVVFAASPYGPGLSAPAGPAGQAVGPRLISPYGHGAAGYGTGPALGAPVGMAPTAWPAGGPMPATWPPSGYAPPSPTSRNWLGITALVALGCGLILAPLVGLFAIGALILAGLGRKACRRGLATNRGVCTTATIFGWIMLGLWAIALVPLGAWLLWAVYSL
jgi:hypothetical protein